MSQNKLGQVGDAMIAAMLHKQRRLLADLDAGLVARHSDPLERLERREKARAERHMGSVVRRLHRQGKLADRQLDALERWAADHAASVVGVRSQLGRDGSAGAGEGGSPTHAAELALGRYRAARAALYVGAGLRAGSVTEAVACRNLSLAAATRDVLGKSKGQASVEAGDMLREGAAALERHYRGRGT